MSHIVTIQTKVHDRAAIRLACQRLHLPDPEEGSASLYSGQVSGLLLHLPGWEYPAVIDPLAGSIHYDNFEGRWGEQAKLDQFLQMYAVEKTKLEARRRGLSISETALQDGSIKLQILQGS